MKKAKDLLRLVQLHTFGLEMPDADHLAQQMMQMGVIEPDLVTHRSSLSSVDRSPSGKPSSRALSNRRMIFPLRVFGRFARKSISFGATAAPSFRRAWPWSSLRRSSEGEKPD